MLVLDTIEIIKESVEFYEISTDDNYIVDFKISYFGKKLEDISTVKYRVLDEDGNRDEQGGCVLTCPPIVCSKKL